MVAKPQLTGTTRGRAGVPAARAQRLNAAASSSEKTGSSFGLLPVGLVGAGLAVVVFVFTTSDQTAGQETSEPSSAQISTLSPLATEDLVAQIEATSSVPPDVPVSSLAERPRLEPCVETIEVTIRRLEGANADGFDWDVKQNYLNDLAQSVMDCRLASVNLEGDVKLARTELADLRIRWDRENAVLGLTIVDSVAPGSTPVLSTDDGQPIDFIVH